MHNHSYENEFNLHVNEISFSYEKMSTKTRFEEEAKGNSEMAYLNNFMLIIFEIKRVTTATINIVTLNLPQSFLGCHATFKTSQKTAPEATQYRTLQG